MYLVRDIMYCKPGKARAVDMKPQLFLAIALMVGGVAIAAQHGDERGTG